jgi:hypothetical protein
VARSERKRNGGTGWRSFKGGAAGRQRTGSLGCEGATRLCFEQGSAGGR